MSTNHEVAKVVEVHEFQDHPNADKLKLVKVGTMQVCYGGDPQPGVYVHVSPEAFGPRETFEKLGVWKYVQHKVKGGKEYGRVRAAKLRQQFSYGFLVPGQEWLELFPAGAGPFTPGMNVQNEADLEHYDPDVHDEHRTDHRAFIAGTIDPSMELEHRLFPKYGGILNFHKEPTLIREGEHVTITEKIHGTNSRIGLVRNDFTSWCLMFGSNNKRRAFGQGSLYEKPFQMFPNLPKLLRSVGENQVVLFGEIFGAGIQDLNYGKTQASYRAFDLLVDGVYVTRQQLKEWCEELGVPVVPVLYEGPFSVDKAWELARGNTTIDGAAHIREGVVVTTNDHRQLKLINEDYLIRDGGTEGH